MHKILFLSAFLLSSCYTTSTLTLNTGGGYEGEITKENDHSVRIKTEDGKERVIENAEIRDIDHPGDIHFIVGTTFTAIGLLGLSFVIITIINKPEFGPSGEFYFLTTVPPLALGLPMAIWGGNTWMTAKNKETEATLSVEPTAFDAKGISAGMNVKLQF